MATNISVTRAGRAVSASASMAPWKETVSMSNAPRGGPATKRRPNMVWLKPLTRLSWSSGAISEVEASMAGWWKALPMERRKAARYTCHTSMAPIQNSQAMAREMRALALSARTMTRRRLQRSMQTPATGLRSTSGPRARMPAMARTVAEPVSLVSHHTTAN